MSFEYYSNGGRCILWRASAPRPPPARPRCPRHAQGRHDPSGPVPADGRSHQRHTGGRGHARRAECRRNGCDAARTGRRAPRQRRCRRRPGAARRTRHARCSARVDSHGAGRTHRPAARRADGRCVQILFEAAGKPGPELRADDRSDAGDRRQRRLRARLCSGTRAPGASGSSASSPPRKGSRSSSSTIRQCTSTRRSWTRASTSTSSSSLAWEISAIGSTARRKAQPSALRDSPFG